MTTQRTAIVTGAARGIGAEVARRLASDGHKVAVLDLDEAACVKVAEEIAADGGTAIGVGVDVADETKVVAAVTRVAQECAHHPGQQCGHPARQPAVQDVRLGLGSGHGGAPARRLPDVARGAEVPDQGGLGPHRQPLLHLCSR
jgi:NAD(P)-dependent dehydrogenase (short-subunit alcohol dehydrogenase family)